MRKSKLLKNLATFAASTESIKVNAQNLRNIRIGLDGLGTGTTATTLATQIAAISTVKLVVGGEIETLLNHTDLFALNFILHDLMPDICPSKPVWLLSTTVDNTALFLKTILPVALTTDKDVYIEFGYTGLANADTLRLAIAAEYGDKPYPAKPLALRFISATAATSFVEYDISVAGKKLVGLLIFATTIPNGTTDEASVEELKLLVKREEKFHTHWFCMDYCDVDVEDAVVHAVTDNYRYIDLLDDPIPADDLKVAFKSVAATDAVRFIGVYR
jgi:hypothetical protein